MMTDLTSKKVIVAKGLMFLGIAMVTALLLLFENPTLKLGVLLALLVWSSCRFYYFLFYVLEQYVDPTMRYAGLWDLALECAAGNKTCSATADRVLYSRSGNNGCPTA